MCCSSYTLFIFVSSYQPASEEQAQFTNKILAKFSSLKTLNIVNYCLGMEHLESKGQANGLEVQIAKCKEFCSSQLKKANSKLHFQIINPNISLVIVFHQIIGPC